MFIFEIIHLKIPFAYFPIQIIPQCAPLGTPNIKYLQFCRKYPQLSAFAPALRVTLMPCAEYFKKKTAALNIPAPHKSMMYYDECLANFFEKIKSQPWFSNTVFIFCSDHWASPSNAHDEDGINSFRIPIIVYEPSANKKEMQSNYVSQFDIMNTVMAYAGIKDSIISYGNSLTDARLFPNRTVFTKKNEAVYQAINSQYALGINADNGEILYCYQYKTDKEKKYNLWPSKDTAILKLANELKAFLQTAYEQYKNK